MELYPQQCLCSVTVMPILIIQCVHCAYYTEHSTALHTSLHTIPLYSTVQCTTVYCTEQYQCIAHCNKLQMYCTEQYTALVGPYVHMFGGQRLPVILLIQYWGNVYFCYYDIYVFHWSHVICLPDPRGAGLHLAFQF